MRANRPGRYHSTANLAYRRSSRTAEQTGQNISQTNHRMRQVSRSLQASEIASMVLGRKSLLRSHLQVIHRKIELVYRKESSRCMAICLKRLIILFVIVVLWDRGFISEGKEFSRFRAVCLKRLIILTSLLYSGTGDSCRGGSGLFA